MAQDANVNLDELVEDVIEKYATEKEKRKRRGPKGHYLPKVAPNPGPSSDTLVPAPLTTDLSWLKKTITAATFVNRYPTPKDVENSVEEYLGKHPCTSETTIPTISGLALWLGFISSQHLITCCREPLPGQKSTIPQEYITPIRKAVTYMESLHEQNMMKPGNRSGSIFYLKNRGWSDIPAKPEGHKGNTINIIISSKDTDKGLKAALSSITAEAEVIDSKPLESDTGESEESDE